MRDIVSPLLGFGSPFGQRRSALIVFAPRVDENKCIVVDGVPSGAASVSVDINNCIVVENIG